MASFRARLFTLEEARQALPRVRALMDQAQAAREAILSIQPGLWPAMAKAAGNGHGVETGEVLDHYQALQKSVKSILSMGVVVKDLDQGLVDFLSERDGRQVFLCWKQGEDDIEFWHDIDSGFAGRKPVED